MHRAMLFAIQALAGCAQLFGIDSTSGFDAGSGSGSGRVSLQIQRVSIGASVTMAPQDLTGQTAEYLVGDSTSLMRTAAAISGPGVWTADIASGTPPAEFTLPDISGSARHYVSLPSRTVSDYFEVFEHPNPTAASATSQLALNVTLPAPYSGEALYVEAVGAWMLHGLTGIELPAANATTVTVTIAYSTFTPMLGGMATRITAADVVFVLRYIGNQLTGVFQVPPFYQGDGTDAIAGTMIAVAQDRVVNIALPTDLTQRYAAVLPAVGVYGMSWAINAAPGAAVAENYGPRLLAGSPATGDTSVVAPYGNPFAALGWPAIFILGTSATRAYVLNGVPVELAAGLASFVDAGATAAPIDAGIPTMIRLGTTELTTDGQMVTLQPGTPITISIVPDKESDLYQLEIYELVLSGNGYDRQLMVDALSTQKDFVLPSDLFASGHTYVIRGGCLTGSAPQASNGDLVTEQFPFSYGAFDSAVFTLQ